MPRFFEALAYREKHLEEEAIQCKKHPRAVFVEEVIRQGFNTGYMALGGVIGAVMVGAFIPFGIALGPVAAAFAIGTAIVALPLIGINMFLMRTLQEDSPWASFMLRNTINLGAMAAAPAIGALVLGLSVNPLMLAFLAFAAIAAIVYAATAFQDCITSTYTSQRPAPTAAAAAPRP